MGPAKHFSVLNLNETTHVLKVKPVDCALMLLRVCWSQGLVCGYVFGNVSLQSCSQLLNPASLLYPEMSWQKSLCNYAASLDKVNHLYKRQLAKSRS